MTGHFCSHPRNNRSSALLSPCPQSCDTYVVVASKTFAFESIVVRSELQPHSSCCIGVAGLVTPGIALACGGADEKAVVGEYHGYESLMAILPFTGGKGRVPGTPERLSTHRGNTWPTNTSGRDSMLPTLRFRHFPLPISVYASWREKQRLSRLSQPRRCSANREWQRRRQSVACW